MRRLKQTANEAKLDAAEAVAKAKARTIAAEQEVSNLRLSLRKAEETAFSAERAAAVAKADSIRAVAAAEAAAVVARESARVSELEAEVTALSAKLAEALAAHEKEKQGRAAAEASNAAASAKREAQLLVEVRQTKEAAGEASVKDQTKARELATKAEARAVAAEAAAREAEAASCKERNEHNSTILQLKTQLKAAKSNSSQKEAWRKEEVRPCACGGRPPALGALQLLTPSGS